MNRFNIKNIYKHPFSTIVGLLISFICFFFVFSGKASLAEASPLLLVTVPFLLYGKDKSADV